MQGNKRFSLLNSVLVDHGSQFILEYSPVKGEYLTKRLKPITYHVTFPCDQDSFYYFDFEFGRVRRYYLGKGKGDRGKDVVIINLVSLPVTVVTQTSQHEFVISSSEGNVDLLDVSSPKKPKLSRLLENLTDLWSAWMVRSRYGTFLGTRQESDAKLYVEKEGKFNLLFTEDTNWGECLLSRQDPPSFAVQLPNSRVAVYQITSDKKAPELVSTFGTGRTLDSAELECVHPNLITSRIRYDEGTVHDHRFEYQRHFYSLEERKVTVEELSSNRNEIIISLGGTYYLYYSGGVIRIYRTEGSNHLLCFVHWKTLKQKGKVKITSLGITRRSRLKASKYLGKFTRLPLVLSQEAVAFM